MQTHYACDSRSSMSLCRSLELVVRLPSQVLHWMLSAVACCMQMLCHRTTFAFLPVCASENVCIRQVFGRCSQICVEMPATDTGYMCGCTEGYSLQRNGYICQANGEVWDDTEFTQLSAESFQIALRLAPLHAQIARLCVSYYQYCHAFLPLLSTSSNHVDPEPLVVLSSESDIFSFNTRLRAFLSVASGNSTVSALAYDTPNRVCQLRIHVASSLPEFIL